MTFVRMAWRNIWRNHRRSLLTISAAGFGLCILIFQQSMIRGLQYQLIENSVRTESGHLQITHPEYLRAHRVEYRIEDAKPLSALVRSTEGVAAVTTRTRFSGLISTAENSVGIAVAGIDPILEPAITNIKDFVVAGRYLEPGDEKAIVIGVSLAQDLGLVERDPQTGEQVYLLEDKVVVMTQSYYGELSAELFRLAGVIKVGSPPFDTNMAYIPEQAARAMLGYGEAASEIVITAQSLDEVELVAERLRQAIKLQDAAVFTWKEIVPKIMELIEMQRAGMMIFVVIIYFLVALGIINTLLMAVLERTREFGIMMALGTRPWHIVRMIIWEAAFLGVGGLILGNILGYFVVLYFSRHGIDLSNFSDAVSHLMPTSKIMYTRYAPPYVAMSSVSVLVTAVLAAVYPALKAALLRPVKALRYV